MYLICSQQYMFHNIPQPGEGKKITFYLIHSLYQYIQNDLTPYNCSEDQPEDIFDKNKMILLKNKSRVPIL